MTRDIVTSLVYNPNSPVNALAIRLGADKDREFSGPGYTGEVCDTSPTPTVSLNIQHASAAKADAILAILKNPN